MTDNRAHIQVYTTRMPIDGWSSLAIVGIAAAIATAIPEARVIALAGITGGLGIAALLIRYRQT